MIYVKIENGLIVERVSSASCPKGYELDKTGASRIGYKRAMWDGDWNIKPLSTLISEGIEEIQTGYKLSDDGSRFVEMTEAEKIKAGFLKPTNREKIKDGKIVQKTMDELLKDKLITPKEYNEYIVKCRESEYVANTDKMRWDILEGKATESDWLKAKQVIRDKYKKVEE